MADKRGAAAPKTPRTPKTFAEAARKEAQAFDFSNPIEVPTAVFDALNDLRDCISGVEDAHGGWRALAALMTRAANDQDVLDAMTRNDVATLFRALVQQDNPDNADAAGALARLFHSEKLTDDYLIESFRDDLGALLRALERRQALVVGWLRVYLVEVCKWFVAQDHGQDERPGTVRALAAPVRPHGDEGSSTAGRV